MNTGPVITREIIRNAFEELLRIWGSPPNISIDSIELLAPGDRFRIYASDDYGVLPCVEIPALGEISEFKEALKMVANSIWDIGWLRRKIQKTRPGCIFLLPFKELPEEKLAGVTGLPEGKTVIAIGADFHKAYLDLCVRLEPSPIENRIVERIIETFSGLNRVYLLIDGLARVDEKSGISENTIRTNAKLYLEGNGIAVVEELPELYKIPGNPVLGVRLDIERSSASSLSVTVRLELWQLVSLVRRPKLQTSAVTWVSPPDCFIVNRNDDILSAITTRVLNSLRLFIDFWSEANPVRRNDVGERIQ